MKSRKPDLLWVLSIILALGVIATSYGSGLLQGFDVQARPFSSVYVSSAMTSR